MLALLAVGCGISKIDLGARTTDAEVGATGGTSSGSGGMNTGTGGKGATSCETSLVATPESNYWIHSSFELGVTKVKPSSNLTFDWSGVDSDLLGHPVDLDQIGMLEIGLWSLTPEEFSYRMDTDTLRLADKVVLATLLPEPGQTSGELFDLTELGQPIEVDQILAYVDIEQYPPENNVYAAMLAEGTELGKGTRMILGFQLAADEDNTQVVMDSASSDFALEVSLHDLQALKIPVATSSLSIDWKSMKTTAAGLEFVPSQITQVRIAKFLHPVSELEERFVDLELLADELYSAKVPAGSVFDLSKLKDAEGTPFQGIDDEGTWALALNCGNCNNPAPWYMTILSPCRP